MPEHRSRLIAYSGLLAIAAACLGGCQTRTPSPRAAGAAVIVEEPAPPEPAWAALMQPRDRERIGGVDAAWSEGLDRARRAGFARRLRAEGPLLDPAAALPRAAPAPGSYRCRLVRLGSPLRRRAFTAHPPSFCHVGVEGPLLSLTRQTGAARPGGYLHDDSDARQIFIGATAIGNEEVPPAYGDAPARDVVGVFERIGPMRYRLVMPRPNDGAAIDVMELVAAPPPAAS